MLRHAVEAMTGAVVTGEILQRTEWVEGECPEGAGISARNLRQSGSALTARYDEFGYVA